MYTLKLVYMYINRVNMYTYVLKIQSILQMANSSEHEFLSQAINILRHVKKLLIFNSHYSYVKLLFKVKQKDWNGPTTQKNGYLLSTNHRNMYV